MVNIQINGLKTSVPQGTTILAAAKQVGITIPTLCYLEGINEIGACRVCVVEVEGIDRLAAACNVEVCEGMIIETNSPRARKARETNVKLLLSQHDCHCPTCVRSGNCVLQRLAEDLNILDTSYSAVPRENRWNSAAPLIRNESKCIKCMRCIQVCDKIQDLGVWDLSGTGWRTTVGVKGNQKIEDSDCTYCGQCITHCPVGALQARDDTERVFEALDDPEIVTIVQTAPAVRSAWAEAFGLDREEATPELMAAALRRMGFNYVFDTNFAADLTIMEEGSEFLNRFTAKADHPWPMFTSCCPGWLRFIKSQYPEYLENLSTAKSPQQMFGAIAKSYFAEKMGIDPHKIFCLSIMPCVSKKNESALPEMTDACGDPDVDAVITTREFSRMLRVLNIDPADLKEEPFDSPLGSGTGAAVVFGATGGVMDAALRSAYYLVTGNNPPADAFRAVRGMDGWKEASFEVPGAGEVNVAVVSGLGNTRKLMEAIKKKKANYDFVEVMACPGGCVGGGGQPMVDGEELADERGEILWNLDKESAIRYSHENQDVLALYDAFLEEPLGHKSHCLLHTEHKV